MAKDFDDGDDVRGCAKFALFAFFVFFTLEIAYGQQSTSSEIISITTIPTCVNVFGDGTLNTQKLCGDNGDFQNVGEIRLNLKVGQSSALSSSGTSNPNELVFVAFPPPNINTTGVPDPNNACAGTPIGSQCTIFNNTITVTWTTHSVAAGYSISKIVDNIPLSYILYKAPFYSSDDDEDIGWRASNGNCHLNAENSIGSDDDTLDIMIPCIFNGEAAFLRNVQAPGTTCTDTSVDTTSSISDCIYNDESTLCNCGANQVEIFGTCGGFLEECGGTATVQTPNQVGTTAVIGNQCLCFPYDIPGTGDNPESSPDKSVPNRCYKELKAGGMHTTNGHNYLDQGCSSKGYILSDTVSDQEGSGLPYFSTANPANYPNMVSATCRHMAYIIRLNNGTANTAISNTVSNIQPFVQVSGVCAEYSYASTSIFGCGQPTDRTSTGRTETGGRSITQSVNGGQSCFFETIGTTNSLYVPPSEGYATGINFPKSITNQPRYMRIRGRQSCASTTNGIGFYQSDCDVDFTGSAGNDGGTCNYFARWGPAFPLSNGYGTDQVDQDFPVNNGICVTCLAQYINSQYLPGLWGLQRKFKTLMDDWRESWIGAYANSGFNPNDANNDIRSGNIPQNQTLGFNYYLINDAAGNNPQVFILQPVWSYQLLQYCNPLVTGDSCWSSYNMPVDFFAPPNGNINTQNIRTQGIEQRAPSNSILQTNNYNARGLALTPFWSSPACDNNEFCGGNIIRCGHYCDPNFVEGYTNSFGTRRIIKPTDGLAVAKGLTGLAPLGSAYAVSRQAKIITGVDFIVTYSLSNGSRVSQTLTLTTDNVGGGDSMQYLDLNGTGMVGRINTINSPSGETAPILGGVLVVVGTNMESATALGKGSVLGQLNDQTSSISTNPWNDLVWLLQQVEGRYPGVTGYQTGGCAMPIAPFITAMQCFSVNYACAAPWDLCDAIYQTCQSLNGECEIRDITPVFVVNNNKNQFNTEYNVYSDADLNNGVTCGSNGNDPIKGVAWYWMQPKTINAFGSQCGQYGLNPWTFGADEPTQRYVCQESSSSDKAGVPCVPGITENTDVPSPCQVIGGLTNYHGQTSQTGLKSYANPSNPNNQRSQVCLTSDQLSLISSPATFNNISSTFTANGDCSTNFAKKAATPSVGLMPNWNYVNPQWWVNKGYVLTNELQLSSLTLDVSLYISGYGLSAQVTNVDNGQFVNNDNICILFQNSDASYANLTVQNIGSSSAGYTVSLINCLDTSTTSTTSLCSSFPQSNTIDPGQILAFQMALTCPALSNFNSLQCSFKLTPEAYPTTVLGQVTINCNVAGFLQQQGSGQIGRDGLLLNQSANPPDRCATDDAGFGCWLVNGGLLSQITFYIIIICIVISIIAFLTFGIRYIVFQNRYEDMSRRANIQEQKLNEIQIAAQQEHQAEQIKTQEKIRETATKQAVPEIADIFAETFAQKLSGKTT